MRYRYHGSPSAESADLKRAYRATRPPLPYYVNDAGEKVQTPERAEMTPEQRHRFAWRRM